MKFLLALLLPVMALSETEVEVEETRASIGALIRPLMPGQKGRAAPGGLGFEACEKHKIDWSSLILQQRPTTMEYTFREGCDIQGKITPQVFRSFPIDLKIKGLQRFDRIQATGTMSAELEARPVFKLQIREGILSGKNSRALFETDYAARPQVREGSTEMENLGGELRIREINGKSVSIKEKILVK